MGSTSFALCVSWESVSEVEALPLLDVELVSFFCLLHDPTGLRNFHENKMAMAKPAKAPRDPAR